ncbi:MAG: phage major capsid protein [Armatimonadetes bacterium]|nr:phage major capsid protein [Armatimonadota bacterium]
MKVRLIKAWRDHVEGDILRIDDEDDAKALIEAGFAEEYDLAADLAAQKAAEDAQAAQRKAIDEAVARALAEKAPAVENDNAKGAHPRIEVKDPKDSEDYRKKGDYKSFGHFLTDVRQMATGRQSDAMKRWREATEKGGLGLNEGSAADGGALVPTDFLAELLMIQSREAQLFARTTQIPVTGGAVYIPRVNETSRANGSRYGGVSVTWLGEGATIPSTRPAFANVRLEPKKLAAICYVTEELLDDSPLAVETIVNTIVGKELAYTIDEAILNGTGAGQPLGIMNSAAKVATTRKSGGHVKYEDIVAMYSRLHAASRANAAWFINQAVMADLLAMPFDSGSTVPIPVWIPPGGAADSPYGRLLGLPVIEIEQCAALGTTGDIVLADLSQYLTATKGGVRADASMHVQFVTDQLAYRFVQRVDGQPWWASVLTPAKGSATQAPFVVIAT